MSSNETVALMAATIYASRRQEPIPPEAGRLGWERIALEAWQLYHVVVDTQRQAEQLDFKQKQER